MNAAAPPLPVGVVLVQQENVPIYGEWVTSLDGYVNANIQPQVSGKGNSRKPKGSWDKPKRSSVSRKLTYTETRR